MDKTRAHGIMNSEQEVYVTFEGDAIWIDEVDDQDMALIHSLETGRVARVPLSRLHEQ